MARNPAEVQILKPLLEHEVNEKLRAERLGAKFTDRPHTVKCWQNGKILFQGSNLVLAPGSAPNIYIWLRQDGRRITLVNPAAFCLFEEEK